MKAGFSDTALAALQERRARLCRLAPEVALQTLDEAAEFLRDRGMLTRTADCSLPSLFEACHEEPYAPGKGGFGQWPRTKWSWSFALQGRPGVYAPKIHHRRKTLYVSEGVARLIDPIVRSEIERLRRTSADCTRVLGHLATAGPSTADDLKVELALEPRELKAVLYPLELCGAVLTRPIEPTEDGKVHGYEYVRWDAVVPRASAKRSGIDDLVVAGVNAAVLASERELPRWFAWPNRIDAELIEGLVRSGRLVRPAPGWVTTAAFS